MHFFGCGCDIDVDSQIEAARALEFVPYQERNFAGSETIDQYLSRSYDEGVRDRRVGDGDAFQPLGGVDRKATCPP